jgi:hypothetical protein
LIVIQLLAIFALTFLVRESPGPWNIIAWMRNKIFLNKLVGIFFFDLLQCPFCTGMHAGWIVYLISNRHPDWRLIILWSLAGGAFSLLMDAILSRLYRE